MARPGPACPARRSPCGGRLGARACFARSAGRVRTFFSITLPLIAPGVTAGALFAFVTSFDEVILSLFIQSPSLQTLPVKIFNALRYGYTPILAVVSVIFVAMSALIFACFSFSSAARRRFSAASALAQ